MVNSPLMAKYARDRSRYNAGVLDASLRDVMVSDALALRRPIDWSMADEWTTYIVEDRIDPIRETFRKEGAEGPVVVWDPQAGDMTAEPLRALLDYWSILRRTEALPRAELIDPLAMRRALGYVMLVDVVENGLDFRYRLFGST